MGRSYREDEIMDVPRTRVKNRRISDDDEEELSAGWQVMYSMGMPLLYILAFLMGITAVICNGIVTNYWAQLDPPLCFLYSTTPSLNMFFKFGGPISACHWVTFGGTTALILLVLSAFIYFIFVRGRGELHFCLYILEVLSLLSTLIMLAVTCTITEGFRQTCTTMGVNQYNNRGSSCQDQLDMRIKNYNLSVSSSTLIRGAMYSFWPCTICMFIITFFHLASCYRRCYR